MSKRQIVVEQPEVTTGPVAALWSIGKWHDVPLYACLFCPFDTLSGEAAMLEHWRGVHAPPPETERSDADGDSG
jgi:hypothetical protein